jgi:hypothetical protein
MEDEDNLSDEELLQAVLMMQKDPSNPRSYLSLTRKTVRRMWLEKKMSESS